MQNFDQQDIPQSTHTRIKYSSVNGTYQFRAEEDPDVRFSAVKNNPLCGICFFDFLLLIFHKEHQRLKYGVWGGIDWHLYPHRITALFFISIFNSFLSVCEFIYMKLFLSHDIIQLVASSMMDHHKVHTVTYSFEI